MSETTPAVSAGYREQLASTWRARSQANEDMLFDLIIKDRDFEPASPERGGHARQWARKLSAGIMRPAIT